MAKLGAGNSWNRAEAAHAARRAPWPCRPRWVSAHLLIHSQSFLGTAHTYTIPGLRLHKDSLSPSELRLQRASSHWGPYKTAISMGQNLGNSSHFTRFALSCSGSRMQVSTFFAEFSKCHFN